MKKKCGKCGLEKDEKDFYKSSHYYGGKQNQCKECQKKEQRARQKNKHQNDWVKMFIG